MIQTVCPKCNVESRMTNGREIYPHRKDLYTKTFYKCDVCLGYVGCHPKSTRPLGTPANAELRKARNSVHALIDPIYKASPHKKGARSNMYEYMANAMGISRDECHVGMFNIEQCSKACRIMENVNYQIIEKAALKGE